MSFFRSLLTIFLLAGPDFHFFIGGWLVLESWMYPEWWNTTGVPTWKGEWQFVETLGKDKARYDFYPGHR
jgi:hypothetical protein